MMIIMTIIITPISANLINYFIKYLYLPLNPHIYIGNLNYSLILINQS